MSASQCKCTKAWPNGVASRLKFSTCVNFAPSLVFAGHRKSTQVNASQCKLHGSPGQTESQGDPSYLLVTPFGQGFTYPCQVSLHKKNVRHILKYSAYDTIALLLDHLLADNELFSLSTKAACICNNFFKKYIITTDYCSQGLTVSHLQSVDFCFPVRVFKARHKPLAVFRGKSTNRVPCF